MKKRRAVLTSFLASLMVLAGLIAFPPASASSKCAPDRYFIYEHANYGGHGFGMCVSAPDLRNVQWGIWAWEDFDDAISSVKTLSAHAYFYDGYNYSGFLVRYPAWQNIPNVGANLDNRFGSVWNGW